MLLVFPCNQASLSPLQPKSRPDSSGDVPSLPGLCKDLAEGRGL